MFLVANLSDLQVCNTLAPQCNNHDTTIHDALQHNFQSSWILVSLISRYKCNFSCKACSKCLWRHVKKSTEKSAEQRLKTWLEAASNFVFDFAYSCMPRQKLTICKYFVVLYRLAELIVYRLSTGDRMMSKARWKLDWTHLVQGKLVSLLMLLTLECQETLMFQTTCHVSFLFFYAFSKTLKKSRFPSPKIWWKMPW